MNLHKPSDFQHIKKYHILQQQNKLITKTFFKKHKITVYDHNQYLLTARFISMIKKFNMLKFFLGVFIWGGLTPQGGLAHLGEMIFIPRSYGIFYLTSIKIFVMSLEKDFDTYSSRGFMFLSFFYNKHVKLWEINYSKCSVHSCRANVLILFNIWKKKRKKNWLKKLYPNLPGWPTCAYSYGKFSSHLGGIP